MKNKTLDVRVYPLENPLGNTKAFASVALNVDGQDVAAIRGIRVVDGQNGMFVSMPQSKKEKEGEEPKFFNIVSIKNDALRKEVNNAVLAEYAKAQNPEYKEHLAERDEARKAQTQAVPQTGNNISVVVFATAHENPESNTKAFANILLKSDDTELLAINSVRVVDSQKGLFVTMPQSKTEKDGVAEFHDIAFPLSKGLHDKVSNAVLAEYTRSISSEKKQGIEELLADGKERAAQLAAAEPRTAAAKKAPGLGE